MIEQALFIAGGLGLIAFCAREAIKRLVKIARHFSISEFSISFLLVGMLSIFPELVIGITSAIDGQPQFGLGVVLGSNIADLTLVIGILALFANGISITKQGLRNIKPVMGAVLLPLLMLLDGEISRADGAILVIAFMVYAFHVISSEKNRVRHAREANLLLEVPMTIVFIAAMLFAGDVVMNNALPLSAELGVPLFFLGILIAVGTCLPELVFAVEAASKRHPGLGLGDVLGNVFADASATIGIIAIVAPIRPKPLELALVSSAIMAVCMAIIFLLFTRYKKVAKETGIMLVLLYALLAIIQFLAEETFA